jgi:hypothetical protein
MLKEWTLFLFKIRNRSFLWHMGLLLVGSAHLASPAWAASMTPKYSDVLKNFKESPEISMQFKAAQSQWPAKSSPALDQLLKQNQDFLKTWDQLLDQSANFHRGQLEDEKVLNQLTQVLQLSLLRLQTDFQQNTKSTQSLQKESQRWLGYAAAVPFDEASLISLKWAHLVRSMVFDQLELALSKYPECGISSGSDFLAWMNQVQVPWPLERILLTEGKRWVSGREVGKLEKLAMMVQKNPYLPLEETLRKIDPHPSENLLKLTVFWTKSDIDLLAEEMNRLQKMQGKLALAHYREKNKQEPKSVEDLVISKYLLQKPIDYRTGQAMSLKDLQ